MTITNNSYFIDPYLFTCQSAPGQRVIYEAVRRAVEQGDECGLLGVAFRNKAQSEHEEHEVAHRHRGFRNRGFTQFERHYLLPPHSHTSTSPHRYTGATGVRASSCIAPAACIFCTR